MEIIGALGIFGFLAFFMLALLAIAVAVGWNSGSSG